MLIIFSQEHQWSGSQGHQIIYDMCMEVLVLAQIELKRVGQGSITPPPKPPFVTHHLVGN